MRVLVIWVTRFYLACAYIDITLRVRMMTVFHMSPSLAKCRSIFRTLSSWQSLVRRTILPSRTPTRSLRH
jgi:hypothetical protein